MAQTYGVYRFYIYHFVLQIFVNFAREQIEAVQIDDNDGSDPVDTSIALADMPPNQVVV